MRNRIPTPQDFAAIKDLRLIAKEMVDGFLLGSNLSLKRGIGMEFSNYRSYQPGDDLRQLDWKLYARSDRYYIREAEAESSVSVKFILDASGSMGHTDGNISKIQYAIFLVAALSYLAINQGDEVELHILQENNNQSLFSSNAKGHLERIFSLLGKITPGGAFANASSVSFINSKKRQKQITIFISDFYQKETEISDILFRTSAKGRDTLLFHLMAQNELNYQYTGRAILKEIETGNSLEIFSEENSKEYSNKMNQWLSNLEAEVRKKGLQYQRFLVHEPFTSALVSFIKLRGKP